MTNTDPIQTAAALFVMKGWNIVEEGYTLDDFRLSWGATTNQVLVDLIHAGTARFFVVDVVDHLDAHGVAVGVGFQARQVATPR